MSLKIPASVTAGDSVSFSVRLNDYPAPDWQLRLTLFNATDVITLESAADDDRHAFSASAAITGAWSAGRYDWTAYVIGPEDARQTLETGSLIIHPDPATMPATDGRSHARKMLDAIEAALQGKATESQLDTLRVRHGDRDWQSDVAKLVELREIYRREVQMEDRAAAMQKGEHVGTSLKVRFLR